MRRIVMMHADAGGEGSRGGVVIGHTSGGRPIYSRHEHPSHSGFTVEDHRAAIEAHKGRRKKLRAVVEKRQTEVVARGEDKFSDAKANKLQTVDLPRSVKSEQLHEKSVERLERAADRKAGVTKEPTLGEKRLARVQAGIRAGTIGSKFRG